MQRPSTVLLVQTDLVRQCLCCQSTDRKALTDIRLVHAEVRSRVAGRILETSAGNEYRSLLNNLSLALLVPEPFVSNSDFHFMKGNFQCQRATP